MRKARKEKEEPKGFGLRLMDQIQNEGTVHHKLIQDIEGKLERNVICYISFFSHPASTIMDEDATLIENLLKSIDLNKYDNKLDLILHSPGGSPTAAEKIILTCRSYSKSFRVIIPKTAMSAATLISMGADEIGMCETSELGPIDPQMVAGIGQQQVIRPAAAYIDAYLNLINDTQNAIKTGEPPHPFIELLRKIDPVWIQVCLKARELSKTIAKEYLKNFMLKDKTEDEIEKLIEKFMKIGEELSHGRVIRAKKADEYGLKVDMMQKDSEIWNFIWELYLRCEHYVQLKRLAKYLVARNGGINVQVQAIRI